MKDNFIKRIIINGLDFLYDKFYFMKIRIIYHLRIMDSFKTIKYIKKNNCSISRFGDGEFNFITGLRDEGYQIGTPELKEALLDTLKNKNDNLLLCMPIYMNQTRKLNSKAKRFWIDWSKYGNQIRIVNILRENVGRHYLYGDAAVTRPYFDWKNKNRAKKIFEGLKSIWEDRDILIIEGDQTRLGIGNNLFDNAKTIKRVIAPAENAFSRIDIIRERVLNIYSNELIIMALGPTATVLAKQFSEKGIQALDIGHIDIEYEWYLCGAQEKIPVPGKYTNESNVEHQFSECTDNLYINQIVLRIM